MPLLPLLLLLLLLLPVLLAGAAAGDWRRRDELLLELLELLELLLTAAWLDPGRIAATAPAASTLAADADTVTAVSRRRPRSRAATACAVRRPAGSVPLFTASVWHSPLDALQGKHLSMF